jgi:hypothetical protein
VTATHGFTDQARISTPDGTGPARAVRSGVVAGAMTAPPRPAGLPEAQIAAAESEAGPSNGSPIRRGVLRVLRWPFLPLLIRFEHRVRTAVDKTHLAAIVGRLEGELQAQRAEMEAIGDRLSALDDSLVALNRELLALRRAMRAADRGPGAAG